jgi:uncharacterized protein (TIGR00369 family)
MLNMEEYKTTGTQFVDFIGLELQEVEPGRSVVEVSLQEHHLNREGVVHGGLIFTLCDMAAGVAAGAGETGRRGVLTMDCSMYYLRPGRGARLRAVGTVIKAGRTTALVESQVFDGTGALIAKGVFTEFYIR